jgi:hypothetical protein
MYSQYQWFLTVLPFLHKYSAEPDVSGIPEMILWCP